MTTARLSVLGPVHRTTFLDAVHFEWIKMRTVRGSLWSLLAAAAFMLGIGLIGANQVKAGADPAIVLNDLMAGVLFGQVAMCAFGALAATGEYATGTIATTFTAVPGRTRLLAAKALVVWVVATVAGMLTSLAALLTGTAALPAGVAHPSIASATVLRAVLGLGLYLGILAVFALALGLLLRSSAGAITVATTITVAVPIALLSTGTLGKHLDEWWPTEAGRQILNIGPTHGTLPPLTGLAYFTAITLAAAAAAAVLVNRRDA
jgi:ABC-2 type transport system permease protein